MLELFWTGVRLSPPPPFQNDRYYTILYNNCQSKKENEKMEEVINFIGTHALALGIGTATGLCLEHFLEPISKLRSKAASLLGKAKSAVEE